MSAAWSIGLFAMIPAALGTAPGGSGIVAPLCTGDGSTQAMVLPGTAPGPLAPPQPGCCAKGCETGKRKKAARSGDAAR